LQTFGYSHYGVESGAICVLHTWGQNLSLHPHIHCIVPAAGLTLKGKLKHISKQGKYLYPVRMLSAVFRGKMLEKIKQHLNQSNQLPQYQTLLDCVWEKALGGLLRATFGQCPANCKIPGTIYPPGGNQ
jgi:hypothetical protein